MQRSDGKFGEQDVAELFCMPQVLVDLIEACLGDKSPQPLAEIILQDTALAAKILFAATKTRTQPLDSAEPVTSAIQQLGVPLVTGIALQSAKQVVRHNFSDTEIRFQYGLWFSSRAAAVAGRCLAPSINYPYIEEAQLGGLLLNLGIQVFFNRYRESYTVLDVNPWSSSIQCQFEETRYKIDHLQVADSLISQWGLDSFLADSVRFLNADPGQIEKSSILLKITRMAQQFTQNPESLSPEAEQLAQRFFGLRKSETDYLFDWAHGLYPNYASFLHDTEKLRADFNAAIDRLTVLTFMLADQEAARARLAQGETPEDLVSIARNLYLENCSATDALFFLLDQQSQLLTGLLAGGQPRMLGELKIPFEEDASLVSQALLHGEPRHSFGSGQQLTVTDHLLVRLCRSRGISCHPFRFEGRPLGVVVLGLQDEDETKSLQSLQIKMFGQVISSAMVRMSLDVQERFGEGNSLLRRVSHEVNNPLTVIGNYAEVLNNLLKEDEDRELAETIKKEVRRIDDIINYYLGQQDLPAFPVRNTDLNQLIQDTIDSLRDTELKPRNIRLQFAFKEDLARIETNPVLIKQILVNLVKNAAEAVADGGLIQVTTRDNYLADSGLHAEIIVQDNGPGIPPQVQGQLFRPVVSTKGVAHGGVGLSIVKSMVDDLGGQISCHSTSGKGTSFHVQVPYKDERPF
ncbi:MAG: HDOD domain-containing protein [Desulfuromonadales bacterium]|nr:HDOD domain-containing protein [Desulfuromonadales bacterium]MBN2793577.1 HDOD domain-containing protein [Desulfuromonadales bacterium]